MDALTWIDLTSPLAPQQLLILRGERHTATNFLSTVLSRNIIGLRPVGPPFVATWHVQQRRNSTPLALQPRASNEAAQQVEHESLMCCWKHGYASDDCVPTEATRARAKASASVPVAPPSPVAASFVILVRAPYAWLPSMWLCPYDLLGGVGSFGDWLRRPFPYVDAYLHARSCDAPVAPARCHQPSGQPCLTVAAGQREQQMRHQQQHASPLALWTAKTASYLSLRAPKVLITDDDMHNASRLEASLRSLGWALRAQSLSLPLLPRLPSGVDAATAKWSGHFTQSGFEAEACVAAARLELTTKAQPSGRHRQPHTLLLTRAPATHVRNAGDVSRARAASRDWLRYYTQVDLDTVNAQLDASRGAEMMLALRMPRVLEVRGCAGGGGGGGGVFGRGVGGGGGASSRLYCGARANCTVRRYGGCEPLCEQRCGVRT